MVADVVLGFKAQTVAECHVRTNAPVILCVEAGIDGCDFRKRLSRRDRELAGATRRQSAGVGTVGNAAINSDKHEVPAARWSHMRQRGKGEGAVKIRSRGVGVRQHPQPSPNFIRWVP